MRKDKKISRRGFITAIGYAIITLFIGMWISMTRRTISLKKPASVTLQLSQLNEGISFHEDFICYRNGKLLKFYLARCTHLGCKLNHIAADRISCPCHGSQFDVLTGNVLKGPAARPLVELEFEVYEQDNKVVISYRA